MRLTRPFIALMMLIILLTAACGGGEAADQANTSTDTTPIATNPTAEPTSADATTSTDNVQPTADTSTVAQPAPTVISVEVPADAAALVNGVPIPRAVYERRFESQLEVFTDVAEPSVLAAQVLDILIEQELIDQAAAGMGITVTDAQIDAEINAYKEQINGSSQSWETWLAENNYANEFELRDDVSSSLITQQVIQQITGKLDGPVRHAHARHILVTSQAEAQDIINRLNAGENFETLAAQYSGDNSTKDRGGDLGWFTEYELTDPRLARFAFQLQPGETGGPFATTMGFHVVQTLAFEDQAITPPDRLAEVKGRAFNIWVQSLYEGASIIRSTN